MAPSPGTLDLDAEIIQGRNVTVSPEAGGFIAAGTPVPVQMGMLLPEEGHYRVYLGIGLAGPSPDVKIDVGITAETGIYDDETFDEDVTNPTPGGSTGWVPFSAWQEGQITDYDAANTALRVRIEPGLDPRINGWQTANSEWMPYAMVSTDNYVRAKYYVFTTGQLNPDNLNQVPNMRLRVSNRFAVNSMLEIFNHLKGDAAGTLLGRELSPSSDPALPSLYRVDFDPVDVPALLEPGEGISRGFEAYCLEPQENGDLELAESSIGVYPAELLPDTVVPVKIYQTAPDGAGDLAMDNPATDLSIKLYSEQAQSAAIPLYTEGSGGVTIDSTPVPANKIVVVSREFQPGSDLSLRARVEPAKQYKLRFHVTSASNANANPQVRLRGRSIKYMWSQKYEIGGAFATNGAANTLIAQQTLPGVGSMNPDRDAEENGGWYTVLMHTPMSPDIQAQQQAIGAQPGPGVNATSLRDLRVGFDLIDSLSGGANRGLESGVVTLDRIEVRAYDLVPD